MYKGPMDKDNRGWGEFENGKWRMGRAVESNGGKFGQLSCSKIKTMLTVFFDWEGVVHHEYFPPGQTINKEYFLNVLR